MGGVVTRRGLAIALPPPPRPLGAYTPTVQVGPLLFVSGMLPLRAGKPAIVGTIGKSLDAEAARDAVRLAVLNGLSAASAHTGTLDAIRRVVRFAVSLRSTPEFTNHASVADSGSQLLTAVFGPEMPHTRLVYGVRSLPGGMPVEVELIFELEEK
ncbi:MAG TPA: RidA family protein [Candidatus Solibacter sp.]|nr:RidA family protein [Candidatus Solibacter sp.]